MEIRESTSRFEAVEGDEVVGWLIYRPEKDDEMALLHTIVPESGRGIGSALVREVLERLRARGQSVLPVCPFVRAYIGAHPDFLDLVPEDRRAEFSL